jgi:hypothetical protein
MSRLSLLRLLVLAGTPLVVSGCGRSVSFEVSPSHFFECHGPNTVVHVKWRVPARVKLPISIYVSRLGHPPVPWYSSSERAGEQASGKWIADGSSLMLRDAHGKVLARRTITSDDCPKGKG